MRVQAIGKSAAKQVTAAHRHGQKLRLDGGISQIEPLQHGTGDHPVCTYIIG